MDSRTRRAFTQSIETALKQHYVCPGNHRFQQDFGFRVD
jgi:periplasmic protein TonB